MSLRPYFKQRLDGSPAALEALEISARWRAVRQAPRHVANAIRLYAALQRGDVELLLDMFPRVYVSLTHAVPGRAAPRPTLVDQSELVIVEKEQSEDEKLDDLFSSFGDMEF